jgi:hypothetical protein
LDTFAALELSLSDAETRLARTMVQFATGNPLWVSVLSNVTRNSAILMPARASTDLTIASNAGLASTHSHRSASEIRPSSSLDSDIHNSPKSRQLHDHLCV